MNILIIVAILFSLLDLSLSKCQPSIGSRISETKCNEYKELVSKCKLKNSMRIGSQPVIERKSECKSFGGLIVRGEEANPAEFPHMAALGVKNNDGVKFVCGGSLISENFVLTAAHCLTTSEVINLIRLGDHNLATTNEASDPQNFEIKKPFIIHPEYDMFRKINDIALLELDRKVVFSSYIRPACLGRLKNDRVIATGWGKNSTNSETSDVLLKVVLQVMGKKLCLESIDTFSMKWNPSMICAGGGNNRTDTCSGDSGGPIQVSQTNFTCMFDIVGVTSYGPARCGTRSPALYTRVAPYISWIEGIVWN